MLLDFARFLGADGPGLRLSADGEMVCVPAVYDVVERSREGWDGDPDREVRSVRSEEEADETGL